MGYISCSYEWAWWRDEGEMMKIKDEEL